MKDTKYCWNNLCIYDYRGVETHLSDMAARGWRLESANYSIWKYRRAQPARVRYAVTYSDGASQFNPCPTEGQQSLAEFCEAAGWQKVCDWFQMQIFCTEDESAVPLETDESLRLENIHRSMRKNFLPANFLLLAIGLVISALFLFTLATDPAHIFRRTGSSFSGPLFILLVLIEGYTLSHYYIWRWKSRRLIEDGEACAPIDTRRYQRANRWGAALLAVFVALYVLLESFSGGKRYVLFFLLYMALFGLLTLAVRRTTALLRDQGVSKGWNIAGTLIVDVVLAFAMVGALSYGIFHLTDENQGKETYVYQDWTWDASPREDFPLTMEDLTGEHYDHVSRLVIDKGSFFLPEREYFEHFLLGDGPKTGSLDYTLWTPRSLWLRDILLEDLTEEHEADFRGFTLFTRRYVAEDPAPWGAEAAYRRYFDDSAEDTWLLVWSRRVALVGLEKVPTDAQKALIAACLTA